MYIRNSVADIKLNLCNDHPYNLHPMIANKHYDSINQDVEPCVEPETEYPIRQRINECCDACCVNMYIYVLTPVVWLAAWLVAITMIIVLLYIGITLIGLLVILLNTVVEKTLVNIVGRDMYNKNFPVCTNTEFAGNGCYATTSTYCS